MSMFSKMKFLVAALGVVAFAGSAHAQKAGTYVWNSEGGEKDEALHLKPDLKNGRDVYEVCAACHQPEGWGLPDGTFPQIAGQHYNVIVKQLADIRARNRNNPTMYPFALPSEIGGPQALADVTGYIAKLKMSPENGVGKGSDLEHGKKLYKENCVRCHGENGEGSNEKFFPRIQGQHYEYILRQYREIKAGKRLNSNPEMVQQVQKFSERDTLAVIDFVSRIRPSKEMTAPKGWTNPDFK
jgi:cytochrome c553